MKDIESRKIQNSSTSSTEGYHEVHDSLLITVKWIIQHYKKQKSDEVLFANLPREKSLSPILAVKLLENTGIIAGWVKRDLNSISNYLLPVILAKKDGSYIVLTSKNGEEGISSTCNIFIPESGKNISVNQEILQEEITGYALLMKDTPSEKPRIDYVSEEPGKKHWLFGTLWRYRNYFYNAAIAALLANILTLATTFFTMNVYDRVVPNQAYVTLWSLAIGVIIAILFEFAARQIRAWLIDIAGKKTDLVLGAKLFNKMMSIKMEYKPQSSGSFANQFREFESVRDFMTSATLATLSDIPFCILFLVIIYVIGGPLAWVTLIAIPIILLMSIAIQYPLSRYMGENMQEASLKHGLLIECIGGIGTLKATRGEGVMQKRWEDFSALSAATAMKIRHLSNLAMSFATLVQQVTTVIIVVWGVYLIHSGDLTMGAMIGVVILSGRALSPLMSLVGLAIRFQQANTALKSLNQFMSLPGERDSANSFLPAPQFNGDISLKNISFEYPATGMQNAVKVINNLSLKVDRGEHLAIIGNIGGGKSTLLKLMARLYQPKDGKIFIDGIDVGQVDLADWRTTVGYVGQECYLFHGSIRENVMIGNPNTSTAHFLDIARLTGLDQIAARHPLGFDMPVGEMGQNLSHGQRQLVALARCLLLNPKIILLDEPTSSMDALTETKFIEQLNKVITDQTLIIVTHRFSLLKLVKRLIVISEGKIRADGEKDAVIAQLNSGSNEIKA